MNGLIERCKGRECMDWLSVNFSNNFGKRNLNRVEYISMGRVVLWDTACSLTAISQFLNVS